MRLGIKTSLILVFFFLLFGTLGYLTIEYRFEKALFEIENIQVNFFQTNIEKSIHYLETNLQSKVKDWTGWDDAYGYIRNKNPNFIKDNIAEPSLVTLNINHIIFYSDDGTRKFEMADKKNSEPLEMTEETSKKIWAITRNTDLKGYSDYLIDQGRLIVFAARKIYPTSLKGEGAGLLVMARYLQTDFISDIDQITGLKVKINPQLTEVHNADLIETPGIEITENSFEGKLNIFDKKTQLVGVIQYSAPLFTEKIEEEFETNVLQLMTVLAILTLLAVLVVLWYFYGRRIQGLADELPMFFDFKTTNELTLNSQDELGTFVKKLNDFKKSYLLMQAELEIEKTQLIAAHRFKSLAEMASGIAHEINNPMTIIMGFMEKIKKKFNTLLIANQFEPEVVQSILKDVEKIQGSGKRAADIIKILRELTQGNYDGNLSPKNTFTIWSGVTSKLEKKLVDLNISLAVTIDDPLYVKADNIRIQQAFLCVLENAIDAAALGAEHWIKIRGYKVDQNVIFEITDSGPGIDPKIIDKIFNPFFTTKEPGKGIGLGLTLASSIIEVHGGQLSLDLNTRVNTCFIIKLPLAQGDLGQIKAS